MRDFQKYINECKAELDKIGIKYGEIIEWSINTRAKKRWGQCRKIPGGYAININVILLDERNDVEGLKNTIIHELLHSCKGCMNHGAEWKRLAERVKRAYGYDIKRTCPAAGIGVKKETMPVRKQVEPKYIVQCECCGQLIKRQKRSDLIKHTSLYTCGRCHGRLKLIQGA